MPASLGRRCAPELTSSPVRSGIPAQASDSIQNHTWEPRGGGGGPEPPADRWQSFMALILVSVTCSVTTLGVCWINRDAFLK